MKPLRVCIFTETYYPVVGGGETQAQLLAEGLIAKGHSASILTRRSNRNLKKQERLGDVMVHRLPPVGSGQLKKWGLIFSSLPMLIKLQKQYDLIFVSGFRIVGITAVLVSKIFRKSCILKADSQGEMSGDFFVNGLKKFGFSRAWLPFKLFLSLRNKILKKADAFSAISPDIAQELSSNGIKSDCIHLIPNSVDINRFFPATSAQKDLLREKLSIPPTAISVVYTGRLVSYKGLPLLLKVWKEIQCQHDDVRLLLLGTGGLDIHNCEADLKTYVKVNNLESSVHFTGAVQNVPDYLQASDIFVFPTEDDAFPSSLIEAMACALPVIATPVGAIKTVVQDGNNGLVVQPGDFPQLYHALDQLISDPERAFRLGRAALKTVRSQFSAEIVTDKYIELFRNSTTSAVIP